MNKRPNEKAASDTGLATEGAIPLKGLEGYVRPPDGHEIYNLIGRVAAEWSHLEHILDRSIWKLAKVPGSRGACLTAQMMGVWPRFNAIDALLKQRSGKIPAMESS
jgi:hypothetical protein